MEEEVLGWELPLVEEDTVVAWEVLCEPAAEGICCYVGWTECQRRLGRGLVSLGLAMCTKESHEGGRLKKKTCRRLAPPVRRVGEMDVPAR